MKYIANWNIKVLKAVKGDVFEKEQLMGYHEHFLKNGTISVLGDMQVDKIDDLSRETAVLKAQNEQLAKELNALKLEKIQLLESISSMEKKGKK